MEMVTSKVPPPSEQTMAQALAKAQDILLATGITATTDMGTSVADWAAMNRAGRTGRLNVRIIAYSMGLGPIASIARMVRPTGCSVTGCGLAV